VFKDVSIFPRVSVPKGLDAEGRREFFKQFSGQYRKQISGFRDALLEFAKKNEFETAEFQGGLELLLVRRLIQGRCKVLEKYTAQRLQPRSFNKNIMENLLNGAQELLMQGKNQSDIVSYLQEEGCSLIQSIMIIGKVMGISMGEAREIVLSSESWDEAKPLSDELFGGFTNT
jgi:hypothetical protein